MPQRDALNNDTLAALRARVQARESAARAEPVWSPPAHAAGTGRVPALTVTPATARTIIEIIHREAAPGETTLQQFDRKEHLLRALFRSLSPAEALALRRRLVADVTTDELVIAMRRLVRERRDRLLPYLDPVRRARVA